MEQNKAIELAMALVENLKNHFNWVHSYTETNEDGSFSVLNTEKTDKIFDDFYKILIKSE